MIGPSSGDRNWHWEEHGWEGQTEDEVRLGADGVIVEVRAPYTGPSSERTAARREYEERRARMERRLGRERAREVVMRYWEMIGNGWRWPA